MCVDGDERRRGRKGKLRCLLYIWMSSLHTYIPQVLISVEVWGKNVERERESRQETDALA